MKKKHNKINKKKLLKSSESLPLWNLGDLYPSITSNKVIADLNYIKKSSKAFERKYEGKIIKLSPLHLSKAIISLEIIIWSERSPPRSHLSSRTSAVP